MWWAVEEKSADETSLVQHHSEMGRKTNSTPGKDSASDHGANGYWLHRGNIVLWYWVALARFKPVEVSLRVHVGLVQINKSYKA